MYISSPILNMYRKLNAKRLLTFGIIAMLTLFALISVRPASASPEPWWFLPAKWHYETGTGSSRTMLVAAHPTDSSIPSPSLINTVGKVSFDLDISAPDAHGNASITIPQSSISITKFYIKTITYLVTIYLWGYIYATADGSGTLDTVGGNLKVDVFTKVIGDGSGGYTLVREFKNNVTGTSRPGDSLVYLPFEINVYSGTSTTDGTKKSGVDIYEPLPLYVTTGFSKTTIDDSAGPYPSGQSHPSMNGQTMSATGVPSDPYTGIFTGVTSGGMLDLYAHVVIVNVYSDSIFKEVMVAEPKPAIPSTEPITDIEPSSTTVSPGDSVNIDVDLYNELGYSATCDITVYADDTVIGTQTDVTVAAGASETVTVTWDTTGVSLGTYTIKAELDGEVVITSKTYTFHDSHSGPSVEVVTVIPEFSPSLFALVFMIITLVATILAKTVWSKKYKHVPTA